MTAMRRFSTVLAATGLLFVATTAGAEDSNPIAELFSSVNCALEFIQLRNVTPSQLAGMSLTSSGYLGVTRTFVFPANSQLPNPPFTDEILIVSESLSKLPIDGQFGGAAEWDYVMPDCFLFSEGATISLGSIDRWEYDYLPTDGYSALYRSGGIGVYSANSSAHGVVVLLGFADARFVAEYASDSFDRHFFTSFDAEIAALDSGRIPGWHQIGRDFLQGYTTFGGYGRRVEVLGHPVCRFYLPPPNDSHFFTASEAECAEVQARFPQLILETDNVFYAGLPDPVTGVCAPGLGPLYRLWNPATNDHWYTADPEIRRRAMAQGYIPEGYGADGVGMCVLLACAPEC